MPNVRSQFLYSSNSVEKLCGEWVLSASVWALVVSVHIPLRTQRARAPTSRKAFLRNYWNTKKHQRTLRTLLPKPLIEILSRKC